MHQFARSLALCLACKIHLNQFGSEASSHDGFVASPKHRFVHIELVRVHSTLHHGFAQAIAGGDEDHVIKARLGIHGEHHTRSSQVGANHALHASRKRHIGVSKTFVHTVTDGTVVVQRREHFFDFVKNVVNPQDIQKTLLLARKRSIGQVFGGG